MTLTYLSHSCFMLETQSHRLIIDPFFSGNPKAQVGPDDIDCDYVIVTHGHNDHVGDAVAIAQRNEATVIANFEVAMYCAGQGCNVHPLHIGGGAMFPFGRAQLTIAHHGSGFQTEAGFLYMGNPAGVLIHADRKSVYHAGDTALTMDMKLLGELYDIDVALLPIGDNFTMGPLHAAKAAEFVQARLAIPMHFGTFDLIDADPAVFVKAVTAGGGNARTLAIGESLTF